MAKPRRSRVGLAYSAPMCSPFSAIERFISQKIPRVKLENFNYKYTALFEEAKPGQPKGFPGKARGVRIHGGYHFGMARRRR